MINDRVAGMQTFKVGEKTTICLLKLHNGFEVIGSAACVNPEEYDAEIGTKIALQDAMDKVWELEGYRVQCEASPFPEKKLVEVQDLVTASDA